MTEQELQAMLDKHEKNVRGIVDSSLRQFADEFVATQQPLVAAMETINRLQHQTADSFKVLAESVTLFALRTTEAWEQLADGSGRSPDAEADWWKGDDDDQ